MTTRPIERTIKILVVNPNSSHDMTHGIERAIRGLDLALSTQISTYTAPPESPASINDGDDVECSARAVSRNLAEADILKDYDAVLVACFSVHPLVHQLAGDGRLGTGIFEASILASLSLLSEPARGGKWGIVTTGKFWERHLSDGVTAFLGGDPAEANARFAGVESTGLNAGDFHGDLDPAVVRQRLVEATGRLLDRGNVECVVMGCAGMAGLDEIIRSVAIEKYGERGRAVYIVDGITAGVGLLEQMVRNKRIFQGA
ncbi:hypothetical protein GQ53DRAFT_16156 [Thozetella sp. PMI_491]|nr:hypothetical protein GQ53DRAFT_16156 [Thozetella sp. PMI_491]